MRGLLPAVLACLALISCQPKQSASLHVNPALEALVPADTTVILGVNLASIRDTATYQKLIGRVPLPQLDRFTEETGLDPRKDLSEFLFCYDGKNAMLLVRGKFRVADLEARLKSKGATPSNYKGHALFGDEQGLITFLNDSTAAAGTPTELHAWLDHSSGRGLPVALRDLLRAIPANDHLYAALTGGIENLNVPLPQAGDFGNIVQSLRAVETAALGINFSNGIDALAVVNCQTERDAKFIHDLLRGLIGFGRLRTPDNQPDLLKLYDAIQVTQQQMQTKVTANVPQALADKFLDLWLKK
jgi:hypothetical protein